MIRNNGRPAGNRAEESSGGDSVSSVSSLPASTARDARLRRVGHALEVTEIVVEQERQGLRAQAERWQS
jgi:hypothetical protein